MSWTADPSRSYRGSHVGIFNYLDAVLQGCLNYRTATYIINCLFIRTVETMDFLDEELNDKGKLQTWEASRVLQWPPRMTPCLPSANSKNRHVIIILIIEEINELRLFLIKKEEGRNQIDGFKKAWLFIEKEFNGFRSYYTEITNQAKTRTIMPEK